eukprot:scaffold24654_cov101-Isochrysis_galbana.AAC.2
MQALKIILPQLAAFRGPSLGHHAISKLLRTQTGRRTTGDSANSEAAATPHEDAHGSKDDGAYPIDRITPADGLPGPET